jgi:cytochrome oxidase Cu insertion factor (SCO1/SenC/PrrC family)
MGIEMRLLLAFAVMLGACGGKKGVLNGTRVTAPRDLPEFTAVNQDGVARTAADLKGQPTVVWFYPAASTPG